MDRQADTLGRMVRGVVIRQIVAALGTLGRKMGPWSWGLLTKAGALR